MGGEKNMNEMTAIVKTRRDSLGAHHFDCPKCKKEGHLGFWENIFDYPSPMKWFCSFCGEKFQLERTPFIESENQTALGGLRLL